MFEREITDGMFVQRWSIVRTLMPQSIAEHTFVVAHYANDIAVYLGLDESTHLRVLQYALWHDVQDEVFTGDLPGPNKRGLLDAIGPTAKLQWDGKLKEWANRVFRLLEFRSGMYPDAQYDVTTAKLVVKVADWMEASVRMATESQMGNRNAMRHVHPNRIGALKAVKSLIEHLHDVTIDDKNVPIEMSESDQRYWVLVDKIDTCVQQALNGASIGPWITREDEKRQYYDPCVDGSDK